MFCFSNSSTIAGTAWAAASLFTVTRTISDPARASCATCCTVDCTSAVSVFVMDWTTTGTSPPTHTLPIFAVTLFLRWMNAILSSLTKLPLILCVTQGRVWRLYRWPRLQQLDQREQD